MRTQFTSKQYNLSNEQVSNNLNLFDGDFKTINLFDIKVTPSGHGHYSIEAELNVDSETIIMNTKTSNMSLIDAWKSGMKDMYEDGEDGFDNWDEVVESMFLALDIEEELNILIQ